jgi:hypothetical protein
MRWLIGVFVCAYVGFVALLAVRATQRQRPAPVPVAVGEAVRFADTTAHFYEMGDSVFVRVMFIPHGRGVNVLIQPVKVRKTKEAK